MEPIDELRQMHERQISLLQKVCRHPKSLWSKWMGEEWAPAHGTGYQVKMCRLCGKEVDRNPKKEDQIARIKDSLKEKSGRKKGSL